MKKLQLYELMNCVCSICLYHTLEGLNSGFIMQEETVVRINLEFTGFKISNLQNEKGHVTVKHCKRGDTFQLVLSYFFYL